MNISTNTGCNSQLGRDVIVAYKFYYSGDFRAGGPCGYYVPPKSGKKHYTYHFTEKKDNTITCFGNFELCFMESGIELHVSNGHPFPPRDLLEKIIADGEPETHAIIA